jgi:hypothetical protein
MTKKRAVDLGQTCIDCEPNSKRPAVYPGPRCATHDRAKTLAAKEQAHARHVERTYGITKELYDLLYRLQGGKCYVCQISTGKARRLAVDHDHRCCPGPKSCGKCVRGLACGHCNHDILPWVGDQASSWDRVSNVLEEPIGALLLSGDLLQIDVDTRFGKFAGAVRQ